MKKAFKTLLVIFILAAMFTGCGSSNSEAKNNDVVSSEKNDDVAVDTGTDVEDDTDAANPSTSTETQIPAESDSKADLSEAEETSVNIQYYTPTKYGTGLEFKLPALEGCTNDAILLQDITYSSNRMLYGIGSVAGHYDPEEYFMEPQFITYTTEYGKDENGDILDVDLTIYYEVLTADKRTVTITIYANFGCETEGVYGGYALGTFIEAEFSDSQYSYALFDNVLYENLKGNEFAERSYNIDTGDQQIIGANNTTTNNTTTIPAVNVLSDSKLEYEAATYLEQLSVEIKNEYRNNGYKMFHASPHLAFISITNRTESTVTIQGRIDYWLDGGGNPDGNLIAQLVIDRYNGSLISYTFN